MPVADTRHCGHGAGLHVDCAACQSLILRLPVCGCGERLVQADRDGTCVCLVCGLVLALDLPRCPKPECQSPRVYHPERPPAEPEPDEPRVRCDHCGIIIPESEATGECFVERNGSDYRRVEYSVRTTYSPVAEERP